MKDTIKLLNVIPLGWILSAIFSLLLIKLQASSIFHLDSSSHLFYLPKTKVLRPWIYHWIWYHNVTHVGITWTATIKLRIINFAASYVSVRIHCPSNTIFSKVYLYSTIRFIKLNARLSNACIIDLVSIPQTLTHNPLSF